MSDVVDQPLSANDKRVLNSVEKAQRSFDGYGPHGPADWTGVRRLKARGLIVCIGHGACVDCDNPRHRDEMSECPIYVTKKHADEELRLKTDSSA